MTITSKQEKLLNDKESFFLWLELGSTKNVSLHLEREGRVNPRTGDPFSPMAIWDSAMRWVLDHPYEAKEIYDEHGSTMNQTEWEEWLVQKALHVLGTSRKRFMKWIKNRKFEKYVYIYKDRYPPRLYDVQE